VNGWMDGWMDGWTDRQIVAYKGKETRQNIISPEGSRVLKGITLCLPKISCQYFYLGAMLTCMVSLLVSAEHLSAFCC